MKVMPTPQKTSPPRSYVTVAARIQANHRISAGAGGRLGCLVFPVIYTAFALAMFVFLCVPQMLKAIESSSWPRVPCTIVSSRVVPTGRRGSMFQTNILYTYTYNGQPYQGHRYAIIEVSSSSRTAKDQIVQHLPPGTSTDCFVNPSDPTQAVLVRGFGWSILLDLIPLAFAAVGVVGIILTLALRRGFSVSVPL